MHAGEYVQPIIIQVYNVCFGGNRIRGDTTQYYVSQITIC